MRFILQPPTGIFGANLSHVMTLIHLLYCIVLYGMVFMVWYRVVSYRIVLYPLTPPGKERCVTEAIVYCVLWRCCKRDKRRAPPLKKNILRDSSQSAIWYRRHIDMISFAVVFIMA